MKSCDNYSSHHRCNTGIVISVHAGLTLLQRRKFLSEALESAVAMAGDDESKQLRECIGILQVRVRGQECVQ